MPISLKRPHVPRINLNLSCYLSHLSTLLKELQPEYTSGIKVFLNWFRSSIPLSLKIGEGTHSFTEEDLSTLHPCFLKIHPPFRLASLRSSLLSPKWKIVLLFGYLFSFLKEPSSESTEREKSQMHYCIWSEPKFIFFFDRNFTNTHKMYNLPKSVSYEKKVCLNFVSELKNGFLYCNNPFVSRSTC
jgi:hypothetical protein